MARAKSLPIPVTWQGGLRILGTDIWFDAPRKHFMSIVSSAQISGSLVGRVLCTAETAELLGPRLTGIPLLATYGKPVQVGPATVELFPAGTMLGSSQALITVAGRRILVAPMLRPAGTPTALPPTTVRCDVLVIACERPPALEAASDLVCETLPSLGKAVSAALEGGAPVVVLTGGPGPGQDAMVELASRAKLRIHRSFARQANIYRKLGIALGAATTHASASLRPGDVLLWPVALARSGALGRLAERAEQALKIIAYRPTSATGPLGNLIKSSKAKQVVVYGSGRKKLVAYLREKGVASQALDPPGQTSFAETR